MIELKRSKNALKSALTSAVFTAAFFTLTLGAMNRAQAEPIGDLSFHLSTDRSEDSTGSISSERHFRLNIATGWNSIIAQSGDLEHSLGYGISFRSERGLQSGSELAGYGLGIFLGWYAGPFSLRADYIALSEQKANNGIVETSYREGTGFSLQARWLHWFGATTTPPVDGQTRTRHFAFGPSIAFEQIKYAKTRVGSLPETGQSRTTESFMPGLVAVFIF